MFFTSIRVTGAWTYILMCSDQSAYVCKIKGHGVGGRGAKPQRHCADDAT